jgi:hypothetical protein
LQIWNSLDEFITKEQEGLFLERDSKRVAAKSRMGKASEEHNQIKNKAGLLCGLNLKV